MVEAAVCALLGASAMSADKLFGNPRRRSKVALTPTRTSLFSDRTHWRWELADE